jgi:small subunit ribosomal protein S15
MYARKRGKSKSRKPAEKVDWVDYDKDEIVKIIEKLANEGKTSSQIGIILRDQYGIPDVRQFKLKISEFIKSEVPEDLYALLKKAVNLHDHMNKNHKDTKNKHNLELVESKVRRLGKYYVRKGKLPEDWKYTIESAKLLVE